MEEGDNSPDKNLSVLNTTNDADLSNLSPTSPSLSSILFTVRKGKKLMKKKKSGISESTSTSTPSSLSKSTRVKFHMPGTSEKDKGANAILDLKSGVSRPQKFKSSKKVTGSNSTEWNNVKYNSTRSDVSPKFESKIDDFSDDGSSDTRHKSNTNRLKINNVVFADKPIDATGTNLPTMKGDSVTSKKDDSSKVENASYISDVSLLTTPSQLGSVDEINSVHTGPADDIRRKRISNLKKKLLPKKKSHQMDLEEAYRQRIETKIKSKLMTVSPVSASESSAVKDSSTIDDKDRLVTGTDYYERIENKLKRAGILISDSSVNHSNENDASTIKIDSNTLDARTSSDTIGSESPIQNTEKTEIEETAVPLLDTESSDETADECKSEKAQMKKDMLSKRGNTLMYSMKSKSISAITIPESRTGFIRKYKSLHFDNEISSEKDNHLLDDDLDLIYRALVQVRPKKDNINIRKDLVRHGSKSSHIGKSFRNQMKARLRKAGEEVSSDDDEIDEVEKPSSEISADEKALIHPEIPESTMFTDDRMPQVNTDGSTNVNVSLAIQNDGAGNYQQVQTTFLGNAALSTPMKAELYDDDVVFGEIIDEDLEYSNAKEKSTRFLNRLACIVCTVVAIFVGVFVPVGQTLYDVSQRTMIPSAAPSATPSLTPSSRPSSTRFSAFASFLSDANVTSMKMFLDQSSNQYRALQWIADEDSIDIFAPNMIQRYVLAVFYYSMNGDNWYICSGEGFEVCECRLETTACMTIEEHHVPQLSSKHECQWYRHECDENGWVTHMLYGKLEIIAFLLLVGII